MQKNPENAAPTRSADRARTWRWGLALALTCALLALLYQFRPKSELEQVVFYPLPSNLQQEAVLEAEKPPGGAQMHTPAQPLPAQAHAPPPVLPTRFWEIEPHSRGKYLYQADLAAEALHLESVGAEEQNAALSALVELTNEVTEPARLQALHLLLSWSKLDDAFLTRTFQKALTDPDDTFANMAVSILTSRTDPQAARILAHAYPAADAKARLAIVQLIQADSLAAPLLQEAQNDPDPSVRTAAIAILKPPPRVARQGSQ